MKDYESFFVNATGNKPRRWQAEFAADTVVDNRFVPVGTGLGKTLALMLAWFFHRIVRGDVSWPRRLVWCLPMRVLVEQTAEEFEKVCERLRGTIADNQIPHVHVLMGGIDADESAEAQWHLRPERCAMFVGTQDMLLSRVLGRGYAAGRGRWPIDFGLLHSDCLWVFDEVQLMEVGAVTGAQLQAFRDQAIARGQMLRPSYSWWASATLRPKWLQTVDSADTVSAAWDKAIAIPDGDKSLPVYSARKPLRVIACPGKIKSAASEIAKLAIEAHGQATAGGRVTLVVLNRVADAIEVFSQIRRTTAKATSTADVRLIHSRFRGKEREFWRSGDSGASGFLSRKACEDEAADRIIASTQVVESGVDISTGRGGGGLITELAPMSSLVQRFGRAARYGGTANVVVIDRSLTKREAAPYHEDELAASLEALSNLVDVGLHSLEEAEKQWKANGELDARLFKLDYQHLLRQHEFKELFDTSPDLTGDDIDISRFIREGEENNAFVCWIVAGEDTDEKRWEPPDDYSPERGDVCPVPFIAAREWLLDPKKAADYRKIRSSYAYVWDYHDGRWKALRSVGDIIPGTMVLVDHRIGGYDVLQGFIGKDGKESVFDPVKFDEAIGGNAERQSNAAGSKDLLSVTAKFQSIADHGYDVGDQAREIAKTLDLGDELTEILALAGYWHDWGKSHPVFAGNIFDRDDKWKERDDIAKAPEESWRKYWQREFNWPEASLPGRFENTPHGKRKGFRHELASVLGLLELVRRADPQHSALLGSDLDLADQLECPPHEPLPDSAIARSLVSLSERSFNLLLYLIAAHHGKVRCALLMTEADQEFKSPRPKEPSSGSAVGSAGTSVGLVDAVTALPIRGICSGDQLPAIFVHSDGKKQRVPSITLHTDVASMGWGPRYGSSWSQRVLQLMEDIGPFDLALLEAILRAADVLKSREG